VDEWEILKTIFNDANNNNNEFCLYSSHKFDKEKEILAILFDGNFNYFEYIIYNK